MSEMRPTIDRPMDQTKTRGVSKDAVCTVVIETGVNAMDGGFSVGVGEG